MLGEKDKHGLGPQGTMFIRPGDLVEQEIPPRLLEGAAPAVALIGISDPFKGQQFPIKMDRTLIGNKGQYDSDIVLVEPTVSLMHARIVYENQLWSVKNLLSTNGTYVNGIKVRRSKIRHGDKVRFGQAEFVFQNMPRENIDDLRPHPRLRLEKNKNRVLWWIVAALAVVAAGGLLLTR